MSLYKYNTFKGGFHMKGENIFKRKDGRWEARYIKGCNESGKIIYGYCYGKSYREAKEKAAKFCTFENRASQLLGVPNRHRLTYFCDDWLQSCRGRLKESTCCRYETAVVNHICPKLGMWYPQAISDEQVEKFTSDLLADGLSPKTVKDILIVLRLIMQHASKQIPGGLKALEYVYPKEQKKEARVLTLDEQERFLRYLADDIDCCKFGVILAMFTGLRIGELCALKWENISVKEKTVKVGATMQRLKNVSDGARTKIVTGTPKSDLSTRIIPLSDAAVKLCRQMAVRDQGAYILTGTRDFIEPRTLQYRFKKYASDCGLEGAHFHTLRHTFATRCIEVGFEIKSLSEILGHATTSITMERYVHSSMTLKRENMRKLKAVGM